jgi:hypothetical protein
MEAAMLTPTDVKKAIVGPGSTKNDLLALNKIGDDLYATNRFWLARAEVVADLLGKVNFSPTEPAVYTVKGSTITVRDGQEPPRMESLVPANTVEAKRAEILGKPAFVAGPFGSFLELYSHPTTDEPIAIETQYAEVIRFSCEKLDQRYGERFEMLPARVNADPSKSLGAVAFYAKREVKRGGNYTVTDDGKRTWVPETWEDGGEALLGLVLPVRIS